MKEEGKPKTIQKFNKANLLATIVSCLDYLKTPEGKQNIENVLNRLRNISLSIELLKNSKLEIEFTTAEHNNLIRTIK